MGNLESNEYYQGHRVRVLFSGQTKAVETFVSNYLALYPRGGYGTEVKYINTNMDGTSDGLIERYDNCD